MTSTLYCGDFNLQDFIIRPGKKLKDPEEINQRLFGKPKFPKSKIYKNIFVDRDGIHIEKDELAELRKGYLESLPVVDMKFLGLPMRINYFKIPQGILDMPKFSVFSIYNEGKFAVYLKYRHRILQRSSLEAKITYDSYNNDMSSLRLELFSSMQYFKNIKRPDIIDYSGGVFPINDEYDSMIKAYGKSDFSVSMKTRLSTLIDDALKKKISDSKNIFSYYLYMICMNDPASTAIYDIKESSNKYSDVIGKNILLTGLSNETLYIIDVFNRKTAKDLINYE